jgi:hypothetical protein
VSDPRPRRRRLDEPSGDGWAGTLGLVVAVILAGLVLGGLLAHFFGRPRPTATPVPLANVTPLVEETPQATETPLPVPTLATSSPRPMPSVGPTGTSPRPSASIGSGSSAPLGFPIVPPASSGPLAVNGNAPTSSPLGAPPARRAPTVPGAPANSPAEAPQPAASAPAAAPAAPAAPAPSSGASSDQSAAEATVRSYIEALERGDTTSAEMLLAGGRPTEASFLDPSARILSISAHPHDDGTYRVEADVRTDSGEYFLTFTLDRGPAGFYIAEHSAIKV